MSDEVRVMIDRSMRLVREEPGDVPVESVVEALDHADQSVRKQAVTVLYTLSKDQPERVQEAITPLASYLESDHIQLRSKAALTMGNVAESHPEAVTPHIESLVELLDAEAATVRRSAVRTLRSVASEKPAKIAPSIDQLCQLLDTESIRLDILDIIEQVVSEDPESVDLPIELMLDILGEEYEIYSDVSYDPDMMAQQKATPTQQVEGVQSLVSDEEARSENERVREKAALAISLLTVDDPESMVESLEPHIPQLIERLDDRNRTIQGLVAGILAYVAELNPEAVQPAEDQLIELLEKPIEISGNAAWALGFIGSENTLAALEQLAGDEDVNEDLQATAQKVLEETVTSN